MKIVSIIIVTYNSIQFIDNCLDSIFAQDFKDFEVVVVDNNSQDSTKEILKKRLTSITLIENPKNYGFSKAVNQGISIADGKYILCLNSDIKLRSGFLTNIHKAIEDDSYIGAVQPKVLKIDEKHIDSAGIYLSFFRRFYNVNSGKIDAPKFDRRRYVFGACAAAVLYRREALETIKQGNEYFDENFFCLVEDVDLSWRMQKKSWRTLYEPDAIAIHNRGLSSRKDSFTQYLSMRNRYLMIIKNESFWGFLRFPFIFVTYDLWRNLFMLIVNFKYSLKAYYEITLLLPKIIYKRKEFASF